MIWTTLRARTLVAASACLALVGLAGASAVAAPAYAQERLQAQEQEARRQAELEAMAARLQEAQASMAASKEQVQEQLHRAQEALERAKEQHLHQVQALREIQERVRPRVQIRTAPSGMLRMMGGSTAERVLAHAEELELTEQQQESIREAQRAQRRARIEREAAIEVAELDLEDLMDAADSVDLGAVEAKMMEIATLRVQGRMADLRLQRDVHGMLTAEQREQLDEMSPRGMLWRSRDGNGAELFFEPGDGEHAFFFNDEGDNVWFGEGEHFFGLDRLRDLDIEGMLEPLQRFRFFRQKAKEEQDKSESEAKKDTTSGIGIGVSGTSFLTAGPLMI